MTLRTYIVLRKIAADAALNAAGKNSYPEPPNIPPPTGAPSKPNPSQQPASPAKTTAPAPMGASATPLKKGEAYFRTRSGGYAIADENTNIAGWTKISADEYTQGANRAAEARDQNSKMTPQQRQQVAVERQQYAATHKPAPAAYVGSANTEPVDASKPYAAAIEANQQLAEGRTPAEQRRLTNELNEAIKATKSTDPYIQSLGWSRIKNREGTASLLGSMNQSKTPEERAQSYRNYREQEGTRMAYQNMARSQRGLGLTPGIYAQNQSTKAWAPVTHPYPQQAAINFAFQDPRFWQNSYRRPINMFPQYHA